MRLALRLILFALFLFFLAFFVLAFLIIALVGRVRRIGKIELLKQVERKFLKRFLVIQR